MDQLILKVSFNLNDSMIIFEGKIAKAIEMTKILHGTQCFCQETYQRGFFLWSCQPPSCLLAFVELFASYVAVLM